MKLRISRRGIALAAGAFALLPALLPAPAVQAQDAGVAAAPVPTKPISLDLRNVPVQAALRLLFTSAGIRNYSIKPDVQGFANITVSEVPFDLALRQLLDSVNPPLAYNLDNGTYVVAVKQATPPPAAQVITAPAAKVDETGTTTTVDANAPKRFYRIPIDKYDAYYIATLLQATTGIIQVGTNDVIPAGGGQGGFGGQGGNTQGNRGGFGQGGNTQGGFGGGFSGGPSVSTIGGSTGGYGNTGGYGGGNTGGYGGGNTGGYGGGRRFGGF